MNTYKASALSAKGRRAILDEAEKDGVIILRCNTNGDVLGELVLISLEAANKISSKEAK